MTRSTSNKLSPGRRFTSGVLAGSILLVCLRLLANNDPGLLLLVPLAAVVGVVALYYLLRAVVGYNFMDLDDPTVVDEVRRRSGAT